MYGSCCILEDILTIIMHYTFCVAVKRTILIYQWNFTMNRKTIQNNFRINPTDVHSSRVRDVLKVENYKISVGLAVKRLIAIT